MTKNISSTQTVRNIFHLFSANDRKKILVATVIQIFLGVLDLFGIAIVGIIGALSVNGIQSKSPGARVSHVLKFLGLENLSFQNQVFRLGLVAVLILFLRTISSITLSRKILRFLGNRSAELSNDLYTKMIFSPISIVENKSRQEVIYALTFGMYTLSLGVLGVLIMIVSDSALLIMIFLGLVLVDFKIAVATICLFGVTGTILYLSTHRKASELGRLNSRIDIRSQEVLTESLSAFKEIKTRNAENFYITKFSELRSGLSEVLAELAFLPNIGKYVIEATLILGGFGICALQFATEDASHAVATLAIFLASGSRIAPSVLRIQQNAVFIKSNLATSSPSLELIKEYESAESPNMNLESVPSSIIPEIKIGGVGFSYGENQILRDITMDIRPGEFVGLVGPSGSGKSTLMNLVIGVLKPNHGEIKVSGTDPELFFRKWPGKLAYVPQDIVIINGTVRLNLTIGIDPSEVTDSQIWAALEIAQLAEFVKNLEGGIDGLVGEHGAKLSGGQRQRLGIARALLLKPKILLLDEATSSLDGITENEIAQSLSSLRGEVTVFMIAHRMSTLKSADRVYFLKAGQILATGTLNELKLAIPEIELQAELLSF